MYILAVVNKFLLAFPQTNKMILAKKKTHKTNPQKTIGDNTNLNIKEQQENGTHPPTLVFCQPC